MNGWIECAGISGVAAECFGANVQNGELAIDELRFSHMSHLMLLHGLTLSQFLDRSVLYAGIEIIPLKGPILSLKNSFLCEVPYRLLNVRILLPTGVEKELTGK